MNADCKYPGIKIAEGIIEKFEDQIEQIRLYLLACTTIGSRPSVNVMKSTYPLFDFNLVNQKQLGKIFIGGELVVSHRCKEIARFKLI
jgi:hypothetical protein